MEMDTILKAYATLFGGQPAFLVRAPGRVNLIGEHTDYNDGFVLPMAIDRWIWVALQPRKDGQVRIHSLDFESESIFDLHELKKDQGWSEYLKGMAHALQEDGLILQGWQGVIGGDVPRGAGLSSSASVEMATARAFACVSSFDWEVMRMAKLGQRTENEWIGVNSGIMDQMACAASREGHALFLDCRSMDYQHVRLPKDVAVVVMDTSTRRGLVDSAYNERRAQCERAARFFGVRALRDVDLDTLERKGGKLESLTLRRARHVVSENQRVLQAVEAMRRDDAAELGQYLNQSHESLRLDFEVTNEALNQIVECAQAQPGCYGARMTGAGFGGCAVALVDSESTAAFVEAVRNCYLKKSGQAAQIYVCRPSNGAEVISLSSGNRS